MSIFTPSRCAFLEKAGKNAFVQSPRSRWKRFRNIVAMRMTIPQPSSSVKREITAAFFAKEDRGATVRRLDKRDQVAKQSAARQSRRLVRLCAPNQRQGCNARLDCQVEVATPFDNAPAPHQFPLFRATDSRD